MTKNKKYPGRNDPEGTARSDNRENGGTTSPDTSPSFVSALSAFIGDLQGISTALPVVMASLVGATQERLKILALFVEKLRSKGTASADGRLEVTVSAVEAHEIVALAKELSRAENANLIVPRSFVVSLISQFDAYFGRLLRVVFHLRPDFLHVSEKNLKFTQLIKFTSIDDARQYVIEKEVESVLRMSHSDQFEWLERKLEIPLRKDLPSWPKFVEITERRNLFVHTDGIVSSQYLSVCDEHKVEFASAPKLGGRLPVNAEYFEASHRILFEIGFKLGHVLWRKLLPDDRGAADAALHRETYEFLEAGRDDLVIVLLEFALHVVKKHASEEYRLLNLINLSICYSRTKQKEKCEKPLAEVDWSAKGDKFKMAYAVLIGDKPDVLTLMRKIGKNGEIEPWSYRKWPLFATLREDADFVQSFAEIFGEPLHAPEAEARAAVEGLLRRRDGDTSESPANHCDQQEAPCVPAPGPSLTTASSTA